MLGKGRGAAGWVRAGGGGDHVCLIRWVPACAQCWVPEGAVGNDSKERLLVGLSDGEVLLLEVRPRGWR
jgi:hypothetical protein